MLSLIHLVASLFILARQRVKDKIARDREERAQKVPQSMVVLYVTFSVETNNKLNNCCALLFLFSLGHPQAPLHHPSLPRLVLHHQPVRVLLPLKRSMMSPGYR